MKKKTDSDTTRLPDYVSDYVVGIQVRCIRYNMYTERELNGDYKNTDARSRVCRLSWKLLLFLRVRGREGGGGGGRNT